MDPRQYIIAQLFTFITSTAVSEAELHLISIQPTDVRRFALFYKPTANGVPFPDLIDFFFSGLFSSNGH